MSITLTDLRKLASKVLPGANVELYKLGGKWMAHVSWGSDFEGLCAFSADEPTAKKRLRDAIEGVISAKGAR